jgi:hypothetical protein
MSNFPTEYNAGFCSYLMPKAMGILLWNGDPMVTGKACWKVGGCALMPKVDPHKVSLCRLKPNATVFYLTNKELMSIGLQLDFIISSRALSSPQP